MELEFENFGFWEEGKTGVPENRRKISRRKVETQKYKPTVITSSSSAFSRAGGAHAVTDASRLKTTTFLQSQATVSSLHPDTCPEATAKKPL